VRPIFPSGMSSRGGLTLGFFVLLAAGLFFIPEIIHLKRSLSSSNQEQPEEKPVGTPVPEAPQQLEKTAEDSDKQDHLGRVLTKFKRGAYDEDETLISRRSIPGEEQPGLSNEERAMVGILSKDQLTWKDFKEKPVNAKISSAHKIGVNLLKTLEPQYKRARWSLVTYVNALGGLMRGEVREIQPQEYLDYLTKLDLAVTRAMIEDQVGKGEYSQWKEMSLAPLLSQETVAARESHTPPFVTDVLLTEVTVRERAGRGKGAGGSTLLNVEGFVIGGEARELQIAKNNVLMKSVGLSGKGEARSFSFVDEKAYGNPVYTFRVLDGEGRGLDKLYQFIGRARRFPRKEDGTYQTPTLPRINPKEYIPKSIDQIFFTGIVKGNASRPSGSGGGDIGDYTTF
jgi:hypothetical protein